ncbi:36784_t:CDS:2, partial [Racocetra persica]
IARGILNGLAFMHQSNILHRDIRCENILITGGFEARVSNFKYSHDVSEKSSEIKNFPDVIRWLAPEMMLETPSYYDFPCETYSRETLGIENDNLQIPRELAEIIKLAWDDNPLKRPSDMDLQLKFKKLYDDHIASKVLSPKIRPENNKEFPIFETPDASDGVNLDDFSIPD